MRKQTTSSALGKLKSHLKALFHYQFDPRWITNPVAQRKRRPKILGAESAREKKF